MSSKDGSSISKHLQKAKQKFAECLPLFVASNHLQYTKDSSRAPAPKEPSQQA
jgi:hypothetical protein